MKKLSPSQAKKLRLSLLILVFAICLTGLFFALSSLSKSLQSKDNATDTAKQAFNVKLPDAVLPNKKEKNKLEVYLDAHKDSLKQQERVKNDPYAQQLQYDPAPPQATTNPMQAINSPASPKKKLEANEKKVNDKLTELYNVMHQVQQPQSTNIPATKTTNTTQDENIARLEQLLTGKQNIDSNAENDPEMARLNTMLDKLIAIQHPEQTEKLTGNKAPGNTLYYQVSSQPGNNTDTLTEFYIPQDDGNINSFYSLAPQVDTTVTTETSFTAVIPQNQTLQNGSTLQMRLTQDIFIKGIKIPQNTFVYGSCSISDERLKIKISSVLNGKSILPIQMSVYDSDGQEGIFVPGAITRDAAKENADRAIQSIGMTSLDGSLTTQATSAGIETARTFLSKKIRNITVTIKAGHSIFLKNK
ncbi:Bacteroides conjugative transposon TraM protein [Filimonas lacunae]|uniref:Bacteroides conjugative transposon TraM protein n=1 Tax=Filimonas lacunae TaxID=477680 RepID=A0A173MA75_9BACT|nr:conjugative transposon protein TraM [Filimonas lacunae]BAV04436.1 conjugative transposon protein TraM [Filimonas lacunae]SIT31440.1 Bacteroides conjugative transposon TraM protein [Filimonas lacunae]